MACVHIPGYDVDVDRMCKTPDRPRDKLPCLARACFLASVLACSGCGTAVLGDQHRYRLIDGPAEMTVTTPWAGSASIRLEKGARMLAGPDLPDFYLMEPAEDDAGGKD